MVYPNVKQRQKQYYIFSTFWCSLLAWTMKGDLLDTKTYWWSLLGTKSSGLLKYFVLLEFISTNPAKDGSDLVTFLWQPASYRTGNSHHSSISFSRPLVAWWWVAGDGWSECSLYCSISVKRHWKVSKFSGFVTMNSILGEPHSTVGFQTQMSSLFLQVPLPIMPIILIRLFWSAMVII